MKENFFKKTIVVWAGALICCFLWGSAFPSIKIGYALFKITSTQIPSQILFAGIRFILAGILAIAIGSMTHGKLLVPKKQSIEKIMKLSSLQTVGQYVLFYIGLAFTTGVRGSIVEGTNVFVAIFIACIIFHQEKISARKISGTVLGFAGVVLINLKGTRSDANSLAWIGDILIFLSTFCYGFSSVLLKHYSAQENPIILSGYQFIFGGLIMAAAGYSAGGTLNCITTSGLMILAYLAFISAVAYSLWGILVKYNPISKVAIFGFMNPIFGVILSALLLDEGSILGTTGIIALLLTSLGIFIVNKE